MSRVNLTSSLSVHLDPLEAHALTALRQSSRQYRATHMHFMIHLRDMSANSPFLGSLIVEDGISFVTEVPAFFSLLLVFIGAAVPSYFVQSSVTVVRSILSFAVFFDLQSRGSFDSSIKGVLTGFMLDLSMLPSAQKVSTH